MKLSNNILVNRMWGPLGGKDGVIVWARPAIPRSVARSKYRQSAAERKRAILVFTRAAMRALDEAWSRTSPAQRAAWTLQAQANPRQCRSAYDQFKHVNYFRLACDMPGLSAPPDKSKSSVLHVREVPIDAPPERKKRFELWLEGWTVSCSQSYSFGSTWGDPPWWPTENCLPPAPYVAQKFWMVESHDIGGNVVPSGNFQVLRHANVTFNATPYPDWQVDYMRPDNEPPQPVSSWTFNNVTCNHAIYTAFSQITWDIFATHGEHGLIDPLGVVPVIIHENQTFDFLPDPDYEVDDVTVDSVHLGPLGSYTFYDVTQEHFINVTFKTSTPPIDPTKYYCVQQAMWFSSSTCEGTPNFVMANCLYGESIRLGVCIDYGGMSLMDQSLIAGPFDSWEECNYDPCELPPPPCLPQLLYQHTGWMRVAGCGYDQFDNCANMNGAGLATWVNNAWIQVYQWPNMMLYYDSWQSRWDCSFQTQMGCGVRWINDAPYAACPPHTGWRHTGAPYYCRDVGHTPDLIITYPPP